jgi:hypothetical protein
MGSSQPERRVGGKKPVSAPSGARIIANRDRRAHQLGLMFGEFEDRVRRSARHVQDGIASPQRDITGAFPLHERSNRGVGPPHAIEEPFFPQPSCGLTWVEIVK